MGIKHTFHPQTTVVDKTDCTKMIVVVIGPQRVKEAMMKLLLTNDMR